MIKHHFDTGIYVGGNKVVHFNGEKGISGSTLASSNENLQDSCLNYPDCGFRQPESGVVLSCLDCFIGSGSLYLYKYGRRKYVHFSRLRGGTCTIAESDPPQEVIHRAMYLLQNGFGNYNLVFNNCENFALYCKTSLLVRDQPATVSGQVSSWVSGPLTTVFSSMVCSSSVAVVAVTTGMHCLNRYMSDIGVRDDVVKVKVEDMTMFYC